MKNFISIILLVTVLSVGYVCQQTKLLEASYDIHSNNKYMALLIDQNKDLRYNVAELETPARLEEMVFANENRLDRYALVDCYKIKLAKDLPNSRVDMVPPGPFMRAGNAFMSLFALNSEAVADDVVSR